MSTNDEVGIARKNLLGLLRAKKRESIWSRDRPTEWNPESVINEETGMTFTKTTCWHFIEQKLSEGHPIEIVKLTQPAGKKGYVMKVKTYEGLSIYIKLQISGSIVIGRSFHYSY